MTEHLIRTLGPASMPRITEPLAVKLVDRRELVPQRRGRPSVAWSYPRLAAAAAWLADFEQRRVPEIAKTLGLGSQDARSTRRVVDRYVRGGELVLAASGVLPWVLYPRGDVWRGWWNDPGFAMGLKGWYTIYIDLNRGRLTELVQELKKATELARARQRLERRTQST